MLQQEHVEITPARTTCNIFGLFRQYHAQDLPTHDPEVAIDRELLLNPINDPIDDTLPDPSPPSNAPSASSPEFSEPRLDCDDTISTGSDAVSNDNPFHPYPNWTSFHLGKWYWTGSHKKSESTFKDLLDILVDPRFCAEDLVGVNWKSINGKLLVGETCSPALEDSGILPDDWHESDIQISVPAHSKGNEPGVHVYNAATLCHRSIISVIRSRVTDLSVFPHLHLEPFELFWKANSMEPIRVHGEVYTSAAFIEAHDALKRTPPEPGCTRERVVIALMFSSDGTHLTDFGDAKLHPLYMEFGNESKDRRSKQSNSCFEHIAYFESVSSAHLTLTKSTLTDRNHV